jgi:NAD(P)-dependent dehydrogenase (short-subunit alcohol dehydrogenase family)
LSKPAALADAASSLSNSVIPIECDVTSPTSVSAAVSRIEQEIGYIDVLINNAGMQGPNHRPANDAETIEELQSILLSNAEGWKATFAVNSSAVLYVSAAFLKLLDAGNRRRGWEGGKLPADRARRREKDNLTKILIEPDDERTSQIITVGSISRLNRFITAGLAYSCSKAAAIHLCKMLTYLLAPWGIRSNVINPGGELHFYLVTLLRRFVCIESHRRSVPLDPRTLMINTCRRSIPLGNDHRLERLL